MQAGEGDRRIVKDNNMYPLRENPAAEKLTDFL